MALDNEAFRDVMATVCAPVTIVTSMRGEQPHGTTVSAFSSLSLSPPMVIVALDSDSDLLRMVRRTRRVGVNVLAHGQEDLAMGFARKGPGGFAPGTWATDDGLPRILAAPGWLACEVVRLITGGDHVVVLALVRTAAYSDAAPLVYQNRRFGTHSYFAEGSVA